MTYHARFSKLRAAQMARLSKAAYGGLPDHTFHQPVYQRFIVNDNARALVAEYDEHRVIAFMGTNEPADWLDNLNAFGRAFFHEGFYEHYYKIHEELLGDLKHLKETYGKKPLYLTGHSLGGACAVIANVMLPSVAAVYVFGCPKAATKRGAEVYAGNAPVYRFRRSTDLVPRVPRYSMGFRHVGKEFYINRNGYISSKTKWHERVWDRALATLQGRICSHDVDGYATPITVWACTA